MYKTCYIILSYSKTFYNVLYNKYMILNYDLWQFVTFTCDVTLTPNPKSENKIEERKIKILSLLSSILIIEMAWEYIKYGSLLKAVYTLLSEV